MGLLPPGCAGPAAAPWLQLEWEQFRCLVVGGTTTAQRESARILSFNITTNLWADLGNLSQPRLGHGCSLIERSTINTWKGNCCDSFYSRKNAVDIIVTGGKNNGDSLKSAENITITPLTHHTDGGHVGLAYITLPRRSRRMHGLDLF